MLMPHKEVIRIPVPQYSREFGRELCGTFFAFCLYIWSINLIR